MLQLIPQCLCTTTSPQQDVKELIKKDFYFHWPEVNHK
ncbi:rCG28417 [Rattus norvegicus]|uniref:RCG28417 n=1 Tax=Rattus norvegicus TaxID=10116 RepID=A6HVZ0_RAT|nr:rCG28417 [Rattus norvegicus]